MINFDDIRDILNAEWIAGQRQIGRTITGVVASDLMSDLLTLGRPGCLVLTSLASDQAVRTADLVGAAGVVVVNGKPLPTSMAELAEQLELPLLRTSMRMFEACCALWQAGVRSA
jgi:predicted transcriptional regulator